MTKTRSIGWIGTGVMGGQMARRVAEAGHQLYIWSRTRRRAEELLEAGAIWCENAGHVAAQSDLVCTMVGFPSDVETVYFGPAGILESLRPAQICIDFTTSDPQLAERIAMAAATRGATAIDAPVSGGDIGAREGKLSIMVGGDRDAYDSLRDFWPLISQRTVFQGAAGNGQRTKLANQVLVASSMIGLCEAIVFARSVGLNPESVLESVSGGAASSWALLNLGPRILQGDYEPGFYVEHFVKDLGLVLDECRRSKLSLRGVELAAEVYRELADQGYGRKGTQAAIIAMMHRCAV